MIRFSIRSEPAVQVEDETAFFALIKAAFLHRRKTLVNSVAAAGLFSPAALREEMEQLSIPGTAPAEQLSLEQFAALSARLAVGQTGEN